jgi:ubiquinone biosynthesis protein UbiJ
MFRSLQAYTERAVMERVTLLVNHVIAAEPVAVGRLQPHAGATLQVEFAGWPALLPPLPSVAYRITPAGLVEWLGGERLDAPVLRIEVDASNPALAVVQALGGQRPAVHVTGDAGLATDVSWLIDNLRWDLEDDLARLIGAGPAHEIARLARAIGNGVRDTVRAAGGVVGRIAPGVAPFGAGPGTTNPGAAPYGSGPGATPPGVGGLPPR